MRPSCCIRRNMYSAQPENSLSTAAIISGLLLILDYSTMGILSRNYMQSATRISMILPDTVLIRRSVNRRHAATASW